MIFLKSAQEIDRLRRANAIVVEVMQRLREHLKPGVTTHDLNRMAEEWIRAHHAVPSFVGYQGYQHALCTSINEEVVHGIPNPQRSLAAGDIISIDCGVCLEGFHGDHAWTFYIGDGEPPQAIQDFLRVSEESLYRGIAAMHVGSRLFDISAAVQQHVEAHGYSVVRDFVGHGIGRALHEDPQVPNFGKAGTGMRLTPGLVLALEPMVNMGGPEVKVLEDGWTVVTLDRSRSAHFEHSVALTQQGPVILSQ
ncbi:MAG: type I methionyl aminopeptidase [Deltaproteobacteria bacterium]|nr:type I methionyl aminopeptidase [Deltaproteobacteria bacterium]